jgi:hypothetical protein
MIRKGSGVEIKLKLKAFLANLKLGELVGKLNHRK